MPDAIEKASRNSLFIRKKFIQAVVAQGLQAEMQTGFSDK
jgi:hypothetical protein